MNRTKKSKVLLITTWYPPPFAEYIRDQAEALTERWSVTVVYIKWGWKKSIKLNKEGPLNVYRVQFPFIPKKTSSLMRHWVNQSSKIIYEIDRKEKFELIHAHNYLSGFIAESVSRDLSIPFVITLHYNKLLNHYYSKTVENFLHRVLPRSTYNICVGQALQESIISKYAVENTIVIPNMVDTNSFKMTTESKILPFRFIVIGSFDRRKRLEQILSAFASIKGNVELHIVGKLIHPPKLPKSTRIVYHGYKNNSELPEIIGKCHCLISFSTQETFGITVIEAMSCGLPILYTPSGGPEDIVPEWAGISVPPTVTDLALGMLEVMNKKWDSKEIRNHVKENFSEHVVVDRISALYRQMLFSKNER